MPKNLLISALKRTAALAFSSGLALSVPLTARAAEVRVTVENLAPQQGVIMTPMWVGFHDGAFDLYDRGETASPALERIAEDGAANPLGEMFQQSEGTSAMGVLRGPGISSDSPPLIPPTTTASETFTVDENDVRSHYFSYASMIVPSNDAFIANSFSAAHRIFDRTGNFVGADFMVYGFAIEDAGTEVNSEIPSETAAFGQMEPNTGTLENGTIRQHDGFSVGNILSQFPNANFTRTRTYPVARIRVELASEASSSPGDSSSGSGSTAPIISPNDNMPSNQVDPGL